MQEIHYNPDIYTKSTEIIKAIYGPNASFRDGQYEAIEATMTHNRTLVVQRTGWEKVLCILCAQNLYENRNVVLQWL